MNRFFRKIALFFNPPKVGDVYFADPFDFMCDANSERIFYTMTDRQGQSIWHFVPGALTYRYTIESVGMPYYRCRVEILVSNYKDPYRKQWLERCMPKRIWKKDFKRLILEGRMVKTESESLFK